MIYYAFVKFRFSYRAGASQVEAQLYLGDILRETLSSALPDGPPMHEQIGLGTFVNPGDWGRWLQKPRKAGQTHDQAGGEYMLRNLEWRKYRRKRMVE